MTQRLGTTALAIGLLSTASACSTDFQPLAYWAALDATPPGTRDATSRADGGIGADAPPGSDVASGGDGTVDSDAGPGLDATPADDALPGADAVVFPDAAPVDTGPRDTGPDAGFLDATTDGGSLSRLIVTLAGPGTGVVRSLPVGINCGGDCEEAYPTGAMVDLTATAGTGAVFVSWAGACTGTGTCRVTMVGERNVVATFDRLLFPVSVAVSGDGTGLVTSTPGGITCGSDCSELYPYGTMVTLRAAATTGSSFGGWSGACSGMGDCTVTVDAAKNVGASFVRQRFALRVTIAGTAPGVVRSTPAGIVCPGDCEELYVYGTAVTLEATGGAGAGFTGWSGACTGNGSCTVLMTAVREVTASFGVESRTLLVSRNGMGSGRVVSAPAGIDCGNDCTESYPLGSTVQLIALPDPGSSFGGWSNACSGTAACTVTMSANRTVVATFVPTRYVLTVMRAGQGNGTVVSSPAGINCGPDCVQEYSPGAMVTLEARPAPGVTFGGWSGACTGTGPCALTINGHTQVTATFEAPSFTLTVRRAGGGMGTIRSNPAGIDCGAVCTATFAGGTTVTLTPTPAAGSGFAGWAGDCGGAAACTVLVDADRVVTGIFDAGLVAYWAFQGSAQDASRNGHDGQVIGAQLGQDRAGTQNNAFSFDGTDYIEVANAPDLSGFARFSLCAWVFPVRNNITRANVMTVVSKEFYGDSDVDTDSYSLRLVNPQRFEPEIDAWTTGGPGGGNANGTAHQGSTLQGSTWSHMCSTYDGRDLVLYVNGGMSQGDNLEGQIHITTAPLRIAKCNGDARCDGRTFSGRIDEVKIWSRALTPAEINAEFTR